MYRHSPSGLKSRLRRAGRRNHLRAALLIAPLFIFLLALFAAPILELLQRSLDNSEVSRVFGSVAAALGEWDEREPPGEPAFAALAESLARYAGTRELAAATKQLNQELAGFRGLLYDTARRLPPTPPSSWRESLLALDRRWEDPRHWAVLARAGGAVTPFYVLAALDLRQDVQGHLMRQEADKSIYLEVLGRTFWMSLVVTLICLALGYPLAYLLAALPPKTRNLLMILVLLPFYTSLLVRTAAWVVLLQKEGVVNDVLIWAGLTEAPVQLVFNRVGVYVAMTHILLPYMVLPLYSVMRSIDPYTLRAASSLGAPPVSAFLRVYLPQTLPGISAGSLLVFILAIGYYITPALLGGPKDQMLSYFVAYYVNSVIDWGMAAALGLVLLLATLILYAVYARLVGIERVRLG